MALHIRIYVSWTQLEGGKRLHLPFTIQFTNVANISYLIIGFLFFEAKLFVGPKASLPEITSEEVLDRASTKMRLLLSRHKSLTITDLSKKIKLSSKVIEQLAEKNRYVIENESVFNEKVESNESK